jgi:hypothetical protein
LEVVSSPVENSDEDTLTPLSTGGDVTLSRPTVLWDNSYHYYVVSAQCEWNSTSAWGSDCRGYGACGGNNAVGIHVSNPVNVMGSYSQFCDENGQNCDLGWQSANSNYGIGRTWNDRKLWAGHTYVGHAGYFSMSFRTPSSGCYNFVAEMTHTWESTGVSGVSVGPAGINFNLSSAGHDWKKASPMRTLCN